MKLANEAHQVTLSEALHCPDDQLRVELRLRYLEQAASPDDRMLRQSKLLTAAGSIARYTGRSR